MFYVFPSDSVSPGISTERKREKEERKQGGRHKRDQCLLVLASKFENPNVEKCLVFSAEKAIECECKCLEVNYRHLMATVRSNMRLGREQ